MSYAYTPHGYTWADVYNLRRGESGLKVAVLQLNLRNVAVDGSFGPLTEQSVRDWQKGNALTVDGIAGYATQRSIVVRRSQPAAVAHSLPAGFLKSKANQESSFALASFGPHPSDWGFDLGAYALSIGPETLPATQESYQLGYDAGRMADRAGADARAYHDLREGDRFVQESNWYGVEVAPGGTFRSAVYAWQLTALDWNWPVAAENLAKIGSVYRDPARDDETQQWIVTASGGRLTTARQWVLEYMTKATAYVDWSTV